MLHGGYRSDFLALNPGGFEVVVVAPADTKAFGGAALVGRGIGRSQSVIEGISFRGRDADAAAVPAIGMLLIDPGAHLTLRNVRVRTGRPGGGEDGVAGAAGASPVTLAGDGAAPRAAIEDESHACLSGDSNRVRGGAPGSNACGGVDASGGAGASSTCPVFASREAGGQSGRARLTALVGPGGLGGTDLQGPIMNVAACAGVCCGLADFEVPKAFVQATAGGAGGNGARGLAGAACNDPLGSLNAALDAWSDGVASSGGNGDPGGGGGGGGAGGGANMAWVAGVCEFPDGLGGAGGGGGAGGCGGSAGQPGKSGGPAIGIAIHSFDAQALPAFDGVELIVQDGATGGDGGAGGDGGLGGSGGFGGRVPDALRSTPTLAGPLPGERGGKGGDGGAGGGGGGGCGGSSIGVWLTGVGERADLVSRLQSGVMFEVGHGGVAGKGGGGAVGASAGAAGESDEVVVR